MFQIQTDKISDNLRMMVLSTTNKVIEWVVVGQNLVKNKISKFPNFVQVFWSKFSYIQQVSTFSNLSL